MTTTRNCRVCDLAGKGRTRIAGERAVRNGVAAFLAAAMCGASAFGQIVWEDSADSMNAGSSWIGNVAPGASDVARFSDSSPGTNPRLTANLSLGGIEFTSTSGAWTFGGTNGGSAEILTIGASGIVNDSLNVQTFNGNPSTDLTIHLGADTAFTSNGTGGLTFTSGLSDFQNNGYTLTLNGTSTSTSNLISEPLSGSGGLIKDGTGTWYITANHDFTGVTRIREGILNVTNLAGGSSNSSIGRPNTTAATHLVLDGGTLQVSNSTAGSESTNRLFTLTERGGTIDNADSNTTINFSNTGAITASGTGDRTLTLAGLNTGNNYMRNVIVDPTNGVTSLTKTGSGTWILYSSNTYTGATTINDGILRLQAANRIADLSAVVVQSPGVLDLANYAETVGSLAGSGTVRLTGTTNRTFAVGGDGTSTTFSGVLENTGTGNLLLAKTGAGTFTLSGTNTNTGGFALNGGILALGSTGALGTTGTISFGGGTLQFSASNTTDYSSRFNTAAGQSYRIDTNGQDVTFASNLSSSTGTLTKFGLGQLTLAGSNTYGGITTVNGGTLRITSDGNLGTAPGSPVANSITLGGGSLTVGSSITLNSNRGTTLTAATSSNLTAETGNTLTYGGVITGSGNLAYGTAGTGAGTIVLSGNSNYTGTTTLAAGTVSVASIGNGGVAGNLGAAGSASGNLVFDGGTLRYTGATASTDRGFTINSGKTATFDVSSASANLTISGATAATTGGLAKTGDGTLTLGGNNAHTGATTISAGTLAVGTIGNGGVSGNLGAASSAAGNLVFDGGTLRYTGATASTDRGFTINTGKTATFDVSSASANLTVSGASASTNGALTKVGDGTLTLTGSNLYTGTTTVSDGVLVAGSSSALGGSAGAVTVASGATLTLAGGTSITKSGLLTLSGSGDSASTGALHSGAGSGQTAQWNGNLQLGANTTITGNAGLLIIGEGTTFTNTIDLQGFTLTFDTPATPTLSPTYVPFPAYTLDPANILVNAAISGTGGLTKTGSGTLMLLPAAAGGSSFTGDTTVTGGTLIVDAQTNTPALESTNIYIGNAGASPGTADSVVLQVGQAAYPPAPNNIVGQWNFSTNASSSNLTVYGDGLFNLNGASNGFVNLSLQGGHVSGGNPSYNPLLTISGSVTTLGSSRTAVIDNGNFAMSANNFTFNVADGAAATDLRVDMIVQNGVGWTGTSADTSLLKTGSGKMVLTAANTYSGVTTVSEGILNIQNATALGQAAASYGSTTHGTVVSSGAQLQIESVSGLTLGHLETLTLNGTGGGTGALRNVGGNNTVRSFVRVASDSRINADTGTTLTFQHPTNVNAIAINGTAAGRNLTFGGDGNITLNGGLGGNISNVTKDGSGTLTFAGTNTYAGATQVDSGVLRVTNVNGLSGTGVTVSDGAGLHFDRTGTNSFIGVATSITGNGVGGRGAIHNASGTNTFSGVVTVAGPSLITAASGTSLTLSGGTSSSSQTLTVGDSTYYGDVTISGYVLNGSGTLNKEGSGALTLTSAASVGTVNMNAGTLTTSGVGTINTRAININAGTTTFGNNTLNTGGYAINVNAGSLALNGATATAGEIHLNGGSMSIGSGAIATSAEFSSAAGTTLTIASGGSLTASYDASETTIAGALAGSGTFAAQATASNATLVFDNAFSATNLTLEIGGTAGNTLTLRLSDTGTFAFQKIKITGDTILDFNNSVGTVLSSAELEIVGSATITVINWVSVANDAAQSTIWHVASTVNGNPLSGTDVVGGTPLNQISFSGYPSPGYTTTWTDQSNPHQGWFDHEIRPTPEPATYGAMFLSACFGLLAWRRCKRGARTAG